MRRSLFLLIPLSISACSSADRERSDQMSTTEASDRSLPRTSYTSEESVRAPGISPTAAPGVAFNYRYAFRLPSNQVEVTQEMHAQACEKLGINRCRITGMRYRLVDENDIDAMLSFKLDPMIARQFGKSGIDAVTRAEGILVDSEISGTDAGSAIKTNDHNIIQLTEELRKIEAELARKGIAAEERARLQREAEQLRQSIRANRDSKEEQVESLATTPMTFEYDSGDTRSPIRQALKSAGDNFVSGVSLLVVLLVTLAPWLLLAGLGWELFRRFRAKQVAAPEAKSP